MKWIVYVLVLLSIVATSAFFIVSDVALNPVCETTEIGSQQSPSGLMIASVFQRDCGATTGLVTGVVMRHAGFPFKEDWANEVLVMSGSEPPELKWASDQSLVVHIPSSDEVFSRRHDWNGARIQFSNEE